MYRSSTVRTMGARPYPIPPMASAMYIGTADDVLFALSSERAWNDPAQYVEKKRSHERTPATIDYKLDCLERQVPPHYAQAFIEVRAYHGLPPSRHFARIQRASTMSAAAASSSSSSSRARTSGMGRANTSRPSTSSTSTRTPTARTTSATRRPTTTTRAEAVENGDEPPPPPYAAEDPDPESTRILQEQLAAVVSNPANGDASETSSLHRRTASASSGTGAGAGAASTSGDRPRPHDFPATPAQRAGNVAAFQPPSSNTGSQPENLSEEERRAREESELEEAMRASRQAEKERLEYEAAVQASLASAEEDVLRRTVMDTIPGSSEGAGPSSMAGPSSVTGPSDNGSSSAGPGRTSFGGAPANGAGSSSGFRGSPSVAQAGAPQTPPAPKPNPNDELADLFGTINFDAPTLQPSPLKQSPRAEAPRAVAPPAESPQPEGSSRVTSQTFQSKNPFLAADEYTAAPNEATPALGAAVLSIPARPDSPDSVSSWSTDPSPRPSLDAGSRSSISVKGRSPAAPDKALPPIPPEEPYYNPPIGPPPGWQKPASEQVHAPPAGPPPGWQQPAPSPTHAPSGAPSRGLPQAPQSMAMPMAMPSSTTQPMHAPPDGPPPGWQQPPQAAAAFGMGNPPPSPGDDDYFHILSPISERSERPTPQEERPPRPLPRPTGPPPQWAVGGGAPPQINVVRSDTMRSNSYGSNSVPSGSYNSSVPSGNYDSPGLAGGRGSPAGSSLRSSPGQHGVAPQDGGPLQRSTSSGSYSSTSALPPDVPPPVPPPAARAVASSTVMTAKGENALEMLSEYDTVFLIDDSTSMAGERWEQAKRAIRGVVMQAVKYDRNGIDCYFLNSKRAGKSLRSAEDVEELFAGLEPRGATPTGLRMEAILREYMSKLERAVASNGPDDNSVPAMNLIVVTDGAFVVPVIRRVKYLAANPSLDRAALLPPAPTDDPESVIVSIAKRLDRGDFPLSQVGVQLLQIGDDAEAREALQELDDGLAAAHGVRDMVDTVPYRGEALTSDLIVKVLLGGINRRLDRRG